MVRKVPLSQIPKPRELLKGLLEQGIDVVALLESGAGYPERSRYSIVAWGVDDEVLIEWDGDLKAELNKLLKRLGKFEHGELAIGFLSYEALIFSEPYLKNYVNRPNWPLAYFFKPQYVVVYDRILGRAYVKGDVKTFPRGFEDEPLEVLGRTGGTPREDFLNWVEMALEDIANGEVFQVVLSRFEDYSIKGSLTSFYERLAQLNPSPYMFFFRLGNRYIIGTSPELLVKVDGDLVETHPIAGTRRRGRDEWEDLELEEELIRSIKDKAEHIMLVDLARNDLGRVCKFGSVRVKELYVIEKYQSVQHLVSKVEGVLDKGMTVIDALLATFPAGTVTGAPKPRAMELIAKYESEPRGPYAGALGFIHSNGGEFAITIRSAFVTNSTLRIQAGAGIVYDSKPELEFEETEHKLKSLKEALGVIQ